MPKVNKIKPLQCPRCGSTKVSKGFTKILHATNKKKVWTADKKIYCDGCKKITDTATDKVLEYNEDEWRKNEIQKETNSD